MEYYKIAPAEFIVDSIKQDDKTGNLLYTLHPEKDMEVCPVCGCVNIVRHGKNPRKVRDLSEFGSLVGLIINGHRYLCKDCNATFSDSYQTISDGAKLTNRMREYISQEALRKPFSSIAYELALDEKTVRNAFAAHKDFLDSHRKIETPKVLGIDENHLMGRYRAVFTDVEKRVLLDMLPKRNKKDVIQYLKTIPNYDQIEYVTIDMWVPYLDAVHDVLPQAKVIIDKFHVIKEMTNALDKARKALVKEATSEPSRKAIKNTRYLLLKNNEDLSASDTIRLEGLLSHFPELSEAYKLKEDFRQIYSLETKEDALNFYAKWRERGICNKYFNEVTKTIDNWHTQIFNYFDYRVTNAFTESINHRINEIAQQGRGYSFDVLRVKALYGTSSTPKKVFTF